MLHPNGDFHPIFSLFSNLRGLPAETEVRDLAETTIRDVFHALLCRSAQRRSTAQPGVSKDPYTESQLSTFGANLRRERIAKGLTQEGLAEWAELNPRTIQKIEAGETNILITTAYRLKWALGCRWDRLFQGFDDNY